MAIFFPNFNTNIQCKRTSLKNKRDEKIKRETLTKQLIKFRVHFGQYRAEIAGATSSTRTFFFTSSSLRWLWLKLTISLYNKIIEWDTRRSTHVCVWHSLSDYAAYTHHAHVHIFRTHLYVNIFIADIMTFRWFMNFNYVMLTEWWFCGIFGRWHCKIEFFFWRCKRTFKISNEWT